MSVHLLTEQLAAEALLGVVADPGEGSAAHHGGVARRKGITGTRSGRSPFMTAAIRSPLVMVSHHMGLILSLVSLVIFMVTSAGSASPAATSTALIKRARHRAGGVRAVGVGVLEERRQAAAQPYLAHCIHFERLGRDLLHVGAVALDRESARCSRSVFSAVMVAGGRRPRRPRSAAARRRRTGARAHRRSAAAQPPGPPPWRCRRSRRRPTRRPGAG